MVSRGTRLPRRLGDDGHTEASSRCHSEPPPDRSQRSMRTDVKCAMPIETGRYGSHCTDDSPLQSFGERSERMVASQARSQPEPGRAGSEVPSPRLHVHHAGVAGPPRVVTPRRNEARPPDRVHSKRGQLKRRTSPPAEL